MNAKIHVLAYPDRTFEGKIDRIFSVLDPETQTMKIRIKLPNTDYALKPEMNATLSITYDEGNEKMIGIPSAAVIFEKNKHFTMVFHDKYNIETRPIDVFKESGDITYIKSGLQEGEKVVTQNQLFIYDALND